MLQSYSIVNPELPSRDMPFFETVSHFLDFVTSQISINFREVFYRSTVE